MKLARCQAAYELNEPMLDKPEYVMFSPLGLLDAEQTTQFESVPDVEVWPEVGSRAMQRLLIVDEAYLGGWVIAQENRYRYMAIGVDCVMVRGVLNEYLAYEVIWG